MVPITRIQPPHVVVATNLPQSLRGLVDAVLDVSDTDARGVAIHVRRHGVRRVWFTPCEDGRCQLIHGTTSEYMEGPAAGVGHLYDRRGPLVGCRSRGEIVRLDRTRSAVTGRAYSGVPYPKSVPRGTQYVVTLKLPPVVPADTLPMDRTYHRAKSAGTTHIATPADDVVFVLAHELQHIHQFHHDLPCSEVEAERVGRAVLQEWVSAGRPGKPAGHDDGWSRSTR